jgi:hypothetical protein
MAGFGNIAGYEETPVPGQYKFTTKDGQSRMFAGPQAEELKKKLDESAAFVPQPTAGLSKAKPATQADVQGIFQRQNAATMADQQAQIQSLGNPAAPVAPAPAAAASQQPSATNAGLGLVQGADGILYEHDAGAAPTKGGWTDRSRTVRGGFDVDPNVIAEQEEFTTRDKAAAAYGQQGAEEEFAAKAAHDQRMAELLAEQQTQAQAEADETTRRVSDLYDKQQKAEKAYTSHKVDPGRSLSGGRNWIAGIAAAFGAYGATLGRTPNFALDIIQKNIDNDIRAQEIEGQKLGQAQDNALRNLERELGSKALARKALEGIQLQHARAEFEKEAAPGKDKQRQAQGLAMLNETDKRLAAWKQGYLEAARGEVTKNMVNVPGSAGRAPGLRPVKDQLGTAKKLQDLRQGEKELAEPAQGEGGAEGAAKQQRRADIKAARASLAQMRLNDEKHGNPYVLNAGIGGSDASQSIGAQVESSAAGIGRAIEGNAPNDSTMKDIKANLMSTSPAKRKAAYDAYEQKLLNAEKAME